MSQFNVSNLADVTGHNAFSARSVLTAALLNSAYGDIQTAITDLNDAAQALATSQSGTSAPANRQGGLFFNTSTNRLLFDPDAAGYDQPIPRVLTVDTTAVARSTTGVMMTYTLAASTLANNGQVLRVTAWGTKTNANGNAGFSLRFGTTPTNLIANNLDAVADFWKITAEIIRISATAVDCIGFVTLISITGAATNAPTGCSFLALASDVALGSAQTIDFNLSTVNASDTVTQEGLMIELLN